MENNKLLRLSEAAQHLGVCSGTIRNWINKGILKSIRTPGGHRRIFKSNLLDLMKKLGLETPESSLSE